MVHGGSLSGRPHRPAPARPAQSLYHTSREAHRVSCHRKDKGLALGPSASLQHPQNPPLRAQALPSISNMSEDGWGHAGFTAWAEQGGDADVTGTMLCGNGLGDPLNTGDYVTAKYRSVHVLEDTGVCGTRAAHREIQPHYTLGPLTSLRLGGVSPSSPTWSPAGHPEPLEGRRGAYLQSGGRKDVAPARLSIWGHTACLLSWPPPPADSTAAPHCAVADGSGWLEAICKQGPGGGRAARLGPGWRPG